MEKGSLVEVSGEANGVTGFWYVARICYVARACYVARVLKCAADSEKETFYMVEYQTSPKSVKYVSSKFIRPLPPTEEDQPFEVDDVVDAYHHDGWCIGKVVQQLEDPTTPYYSVLLDHTSDPIGFTPSKLRHHMDWVDRTWVKRQKEVWTSHQKQENGTDNAAVDVINEDLNMQFLKNSAVMSFVKSMEVFESLPQKPHFHPLLRCEGVKREALAVAHMMTFANIVKESTKLELTSPISDFDKLLDCLPELELNGFNVERVRNRILQLKAMKENRERLKTKSKKIESRIKEQNQERMDNQAELDLVMKDMKILCEKKRSVEEKISALISTTKEEEIEIAKLESSIDLLQKENEKGRWTFRSVAAAPWGR